MIFALTPRAGRSNHRYLVPQGAPWTEESLTRLAASAGKRDEMIEDDCISVSRQVIQDATGRPAREFLLIQDPRLRDASQDMKRRLLGFLHKHLIALETIVTNKIDWNEAGNDLVVPVRDMNPWQSQVLTMLNAEGTSLSKSKVVKAPTMSYRPVIVLVTLVIAAIAVGIWYGGGNDPNHQVPVPGRKGGDDARRRESLIRVAKSLGLQISNATFDELARSISEKLTLLFVVSPAENSESRESSGTVPGQASSRANAGGHDHTFRITSQLQDFYRYLYPNLEAPSQLEELVKDDGLMGSLTKIFSKQPLSFDSCGLLSDDERKRFKLCDYPADRFHRVSASFAALSSVDRGTGGQLSNSAYGPFLNDVADFDMRDVRNRSLESVRGTATFYTSRDIGIAERLEELLEKPSFRDLLQPRNDRVDELPKLLDRIGEQWPQASDRRLSEKALIGAKNDYKDANDAQAIDWLMKLVQACRSDGK